MKRILWLGVLLCLLFPGCSAPEEENWGSFSAGRTESYDGKFYALQTREEVEGIPCIVVTVYETETEIPVFSFVPARAKDFWGICWERDSYRIWIQSADVGVRCYREENGYWIPDETAKRPDDIKSKYDD